MRLLKWTCLAVAVATVCLAGAVTLGNPSYQFCTNVCAPPVDCGSWLMPENEGDQFCDDLRGEGQQDVIVLMAVAVVAVIAASAARRAGRSNDQVSEPVGPTDSMLV